MSGEAYDACVHLTCPRCSAEPDCYCINPITGRPAICPCLARIKLADN
jgi:hypothetical protein